MESCTYGWYPSTWNTSADLGVARHYASRAGGRQHLGEQMFSRVCGETFLTHLDKDKLYAHSWLQDS